MSEWDIPGHQIHRTDGGARGGSPTAGSSQAGNVDAESMPRAVNEGGDRSDGMEARPMDRFTFGISGGRSGRGEEDDGTDRQLADSRAGVGSLKHFSERAKELSKAKREFTTMKNRLFPTSQDVHVFSDVELVDMKHTLDGLYEELRKVYEKARRAAEDGDMLATLDSGFDPYHKEYERIRGVLTGERKARQERETQQGGVTPTGRGSGSAAADSNVQGSPRNEENSTEGTPFVTPFQQQTQAPSSHSSQERRFPRGTTSRTARDSEGSSNSDDHLQGRQNRGKRRGRRGGLERSSGRFPFPKQGKSREGPRANLFASSRSNRLTPSPVTVDSLEVVRLVNLAFAAGWNADRIKEATQRYYQTGIFPTELQGRSGLGSGAAIGIGGRTGPSRVVNFNVTQTPVPTFVEGANATPLGTSNNQPLVTSTGIHRTSHPVHHMHSTNSGFQPVVPMPQSRPVSSMQGPSYMNVPPQLQPTIPWPPPLAQPPPTQVFGGMGLGTYHQAPTQCGFPCGPGVNLQAPTLGAMRPHLDARIEGGMFGNHSFSQDSHGRLQSGTDQTNWGYDPRSYVEKPLMRINHITFDGTSRSCSFEEFRATFAVVCGSRNMPEAQKLVCLKQLLAGDPLKLFNNIVGFDFLPGSLERVLRTLEDHFGGSQRIVNSYINRLTQYSPIRRFDCGSLLDLLTIVEEIFNRYETHSPGFLERDEVLVAHIRRIIPNDERQSYYSKLAEHRRRDTFLTLRDYLRSRYESFRLAAIADVGLSLKQSTHRIQEEVLPEVKGDQSMACFPEDLEILLAGREAEMVSKAKERANALPISQGLPTTRAAGSGPSCSFCSKDHFVWRCPDFALLDVKLRFAHVREKRLCFHCLLGGHRAKDCKFRPDLLCGVEGCKRKHHRLVHNHLETGLCSIEIFISQLGEDEIRDSAVQVQKSLLSMSLVADGAGVLLPLEEEYISIRTVTVEIRCGNRRRRVIAALDSCSNNTNIDADLAEELGLPILRANIPREMQFLERKAHLSSNFVKFLISPIDSDANFEMTAFTIKNLMAGSPVVDWNDVAKNYPHLQEAGIPHQRSSDRVQILIGTEFAELMTPCRVLRGSPGSGAPVAELTDLGWAFSGRTGRKPTHQNFCQVDCSFVGHTFMAIGGANFGQTQKGCLAVPGWDSESGREEEMQRLSLTDVEVPPEMLLVGLDEVPEQQLVNVGSPSGTLVGDLQVSPQRDWSDSAGMESFNSSGIHSATDETSDLIDWDVLSSPVVGTVSQSEDRGAAECLQTYLSLLDVEPEFEKDLLRQDECDRQLSDLIQRHWELEAVGLLERAPRASRVKDPSPHQWSAAEIELDKKLGIIYLEEKGQFQMSIPWKAPRPEFKNNRFAVRKRQEATLRHLGPRIENVRKIFAGYLEKGYIRKLDHLESYESDCRYLPFFCVVDESRDTTPVRIVWDCRAVYDGKSLNSEIELTPNRLQDLFKVLLRLRKYQFTVTSDVSEMFLKILMDPKDRRYHRFVFEGNDYEWNVILFGNVSSPNGSQKVLANACELFGEKCPEAVETISESCYMDDASDSRPTEERALLLTQQLIQLLGHCGMPIHKFYTNSLLVIRNIDPALLAKQITLDEKDVTIDAGKILGMMYSVHEGDVLMFSGKFKSVHEWTNKSVRTSVEEGQWTKRLVSRAAASIYDPHGLISPFIVRAKVILQEIWKRKELGWDDCLPPDLCQVWEKWLEQVFVIPEIKIPRWSRFEPRCQAQLHTFCDASEDGMCCAVFLRVRKGPNTDVTLLAAKARVSPLRAESISRLELCACVLGTRLCSAVKEVYPVSVEDTFFWTDSEVCLHWINTPAKSFKAYVAHRIGEIQTYTEPRQWLHVPGLQNPADIGTRPITAEELKNRQLWWGGPSFLRQPMSDWPKSKVVKHIETNEVKNTVFLNIAPFKETRFVDSFEKLHPRFFSVGSRYNGLLICLRKWAYIIRAVRLFRGGLRSGQGLLHSGEIESARRHLTRQAQLSFFHEEIGLLSRGQNSLSRFSEARKSRILQFSPFLDEFGVLRSRSRIEKGQIYGYDKTYPIILDRKSDFARLLVEEAHFEFEHPVGHNALKAELGSKYIILGLGTLCHQIKFRCAVCRAERGRVASQLQAALPERRLGEKMRPFTHVGMDYAGPFEVKVGRGKPRKKLQVLVLTCMSVRAVHLEATGGMDTTHVLNAISRFVDVRGLPETITTDNQTSFQKADKDLGEWIAAIDFEALQAETGGGFRPARRGIQWIFNPPLAPHFGGVFEIIVKAMKRALKATVGRADLTEEEFRTMISKVSWMLNNRPIQPVGDSDDLEALTPNHFLNGAPEDAVFPPNLPNCRLSLQERLKYQVSIQQHFWKRFQAEIIPLLGPRGKWKEEKEGLKEDDVVIEVDENTPRGEWRRMRVTRVFPSEDGLVRKVEVTNGRGKFYSRPISRLIPIIF